LSKLSFTNKSKFNSTHSKSQYTCKQWVQKDQRHSCELFTLPNLYRRRRTVPPRRLARNQALALSHLTQARTMHTAGTTKSHLTFSPLVFESSFSFFLAAVINSLNKASRSFIFSIALNLESLACLAANSLKVVLQQNGK